MKKLTVISLLLTLIASACGNKAVITEGQSYADTVVHSAALRQKEKFTGPVDTSAVVEDTIYIPDLSDDSAYTCHLLMAGGTYHGSEIVPNAEKKNWIGLFNSRKGYYTSKTKVNITHVYDGIMDEDTTLKTGIDVTVLHKDTSVLLISGIDSLPQRPVSSLVTHRLLPYPDDDTIRFSLKGIDYKLYSAGLKRNNTWDLASYSYWNYKLFLQGSKDGKEISQIIRATSRLQAEYESILFIGDLDGDGIPDMIFDFSGDNFSNTVLYLSKNAKPGSLLEVVAHLSTTGC